MAAIVDTVYQFARNDRVTIENGVLTYNKVYRVTYKDSTTSKPSANWSTPTACFATDGTTAIPVAGTTTTITIGAVNWTMYFKSSSADRLEPTMAEVTVTLSSDPGFTATGAKRKIDISWSGQPADTTTNKDNNGSTLLNAAGDIVSATIKKTLYDQAITISYTTDTANPGDFAPLYGTVNTSTVTMTVKGVAQSFPAETLKLLNAPIKTSVQAGESSTAWDVEIQLLYRPGGWRRKIENVGYRYLVYDSADDVYLQLPDIDKQTGNPTHQLLYLDTDGSKLITDPNSGPVDCTFIQDRDGKDPLIEDTADLATILSGLS